MAPPVLPMNPSTLQLAAVSFLAAATGAAAVLLLSPAPKAGSPGAPVVRDVPLGPGDIGGPGGSEAELQVRVARLEAELRAIRVELGQLAGARSPMVAVGASELDAEAMLTSLAGGGEGAFLEEVSKAVAKIDEKKAAAARAEEIETRKVEETQAFEEYKEVQANLGERVAKLAESMPMGTADQRELEGLMDLQVERMRDLTRAWASGDFTDDEVTERFNAERRQHRQAAIALLGEERIGAYQKFIQAGGVGGRYSFYVAPWERWSDN